MTKKTVRHIFIFFLIFLPLQYVMVGVTGSMRSEMWPAFVFPGFKNVFDTEEEIRIPKALFYYDDGSDVIELTSAQIFDGIPVSKHRGILRYQFQRYNVDPETRIKYLSDEGRRWLVGQLENSGIENPDLQKLTLNWYHVSYQLTDSELAETGREKFDSVSFKKAAAE